MTDKRAAEIAAGLTGSQRLCLLSAVRGEGGHWRIPSLANKGFRGLPAKGLAFSISRSAIVPGSTGRLTDLGEQVRAHLTNPENISNG